MLNNIKIKIKKILRGKELYTVNKKATSDLTLSTFVLNILDHCNLGCKGCDHFSPLAEPRFVSFEDIKKDLARMSELTLGNVGKISIMGGEPLLHPMLNQILSETRKNFPETNIRFVTNGILLFKAE